MVLVLAFVVELLWHRGSLCARNISVTFQRALFCLIPADTRILTRYGTHTSEIQWSLPFTVLLVSCVECSVILHLNLSLEWILLLKVRLSERLYTCYMKSTLIHRWESYTAPAKIGHIAGVVSTHLSCIAKYRQQFQHSSQINLAVAMLSCICIVALFIPRWFAPWLHPPPSNQVVPFIRTPLINHSVPKM